MPFQVVFSTRQAPMSNITGVDLPTEKVNFCQIYVTLEAKVFGTLAGHTFEWEQISGSAVQWVYDRNALSTTYTQTLRDDKVFLFWIDKGTLFERSFRVSVYGSPTDKVYMNFETGMSENFRYQSSQEISNFVFYPRLASTSQGIANNTRWDLYWMPPANLNYSSVSLEENSNGSFFTKTVIDNTSTPIVTNINTDSSYRALVTYNPIPSHSVTTYSRTAKIQIPQNYVAADELFQLGSASSSPGVEFAQQTRLITLITQQPQEINQMDSGVPVNTEFSATSVSRSLKVYNEVPDESLVMDYTISSNTEFSYKITTRELSTIGG